MSRSFSDPPQIQALEKPTALRFLFDEIYPSYQDALRSSENVHEYFLNIGGFIVKLVFAGPALVSPVVPAFEHLVTAPVADPRLTVCLWDSVSTRTPLSRLPWPRPSPAAEKDIYYFNRDGIRISFHSESGSLSILDDERNMGMYWIQDASRVPFSEKAAPLRSILQWWMGRHQRFLVHSAAVGTGNKGIMLAGKERSGKSTTALICMLSGLLYAGDDYVLLGKEPDYLAESIYGTAKLDPQIIPRFPQLASSISNLHRLKTEKALIFLPPRFRKNLSTGFPVKALILPQAISGPKTVIRRISAAEALRGLAPSTVFSQLGARKEALAFLARFVRRTPCFRMELGDDFSTISGEINRLLEKL